LLVLAAAGCERGTGRLGPALPNADPVVFLDDFGVAVDFQAFLGSKLDAVQISTSVRFQGTAALEISVPAPGASDGGFAGGAFTTFFARELSGYDALTFWAKSSPPNGVRSR
jgi:hypothetical protein